MMLLAENSWLIPVLALLVSASLAWLCIPLARMLGWVDHPGVRKVHEQATPLVGGVAVFPAILMASFLTPIDIPGEHQFHLPLLVGAYVLLMTGLIDDVRGLSSTLRFLVQIGICLLLLKVSGVWLTDFGQLIWSGTLYLGWLAIPITVFAAIGVINSFNLVDGMDGLAGAIFMVAGLGMAWFAALSGDDATMWLLVISMAAVGGFLLLNARFPWNPKARVFLGDAGSLMLGFILAWCFIRLGSGPERAFAPMTAVWLFAVPLLDTSTLIWMRWRDGRSAFSADQHHLHHAFLRAGYSVEQTWVAISLTALVLAGIGVLFETGDIPDYVSFYSFMLLAFSYYVYIRHSWSTQRFLGRHFIHHDFVIEDGYA